MGREVAVEISINGRRESPSKAQQALSLLDYLRDELGLTGTRFGCGAGQCGACTVLINARAVRSCITPLDSLDGATVITIEGLAGQADEALHPVQQAFARHRVPQCGFCMSGQIMTIASLYALSPRPPRERFEQALDGNLCRCGTYPRIRAALDDLLGVGQ